MPRTARPLSRLPFGPRYSFSSCTSNVPAGKTNEAAEAIYEMSHPDANIIFGVQIDETMGPVLSITIVATGFGTFNS